MSDNKNKTNIDLEDENKRKKKLNEQKFEAALEEILKSNQEAVADEGEGVPSPLKKALGRKRGKKNIDKKYLLKLVGKNLEEKEEEEEQGAKNTVINLVTKVFAGIFPESIKNYVNPKFAGIGGLLIALILVASFSYLFFRDECSELYIETSHKDKLEDVKILECNETFVTYNVPFRYFDIYGNWSGTDGHKYPLAGPWIVSFQNFEGNQSFFYETMNELIDTANEKLYGLNGFPFFEILQELFYYQNMLSDVLLEPQMDIENIFQNFKLNSVGQANLMQILEDNQLMYGIAKVFSNWEVLRENNAPCVRQISNVSVNFGWNCESQQSFQDTPTPSSASVDVIPPTPTPKQGLSVEVHQTSDAWKSQLVKVTFHSFYETLYKHLFPEFNTTQINKNLTQRNLQIDWNFRRLWGDDYCSSLGRRNCLPIVDHLRLDKNLPYVSVNNRTTPLNRRPIGDLQTIFIPSLAQFGQFIKHEFIQAPEGWIPPPSPPTTPTPNAQDDLPSFATAPTPTPTQGGADGQTGVTPTPSQEGVNVQEGVNPTPAQQGVGVGVDFPVLTPTATLPQVGGVRQGQGQGKQQGYMVEYIYVPQIALLTKNISQTTISGEAFYVCESCQQRAEFLRRINQTQLPVGTCREAVIYFHIYVIKINYVNGVATVDRQFDIRKNYLTTYFFRYDLERYSEVSKLTLDYNQKNYRFTYNKYGQQIQDLHCDTSEWMFKTNSNISIPFPLTTGVESCKIQTCPSIIEKFASAEANTAFVYLAILFLIIILFFVYFIYKVRAAQVQKKQNKWRSSSTLFEVISSITENVIEDVR